MLTKDERQQAIKFQHAIGQIIDQYLLKDMDPETMRIILTDEAFHLRIRKEELEHGLYKR